MKKIIILALMTLTAFVQIGLAQENEKEPDVCQFLKIAPEINLWAGFSLVDLEDSKQAGEYEYLQDSLSGGGELMVFPFPHSVALEGEVLNKNDFFGEARYAYKDLVLSRWISRRLFHNLENIRLMDFDTSTPSPGVDLRDEGVEYGVKTDINRYSLRLKTPDFPFHLYTEGHLLDRKGTEQHSFLSGSGYFDNIKRASTDRDVDWETRDYIAGMNTHLGPVEIDISHADMNFDPAGDEVFTDFYTGAGFPPGSLRSAGVFEHSRIPELRGSSENLRLHTNYTGRIVASAAVSKIERKNEFSGARAEHHVTHGEFLWMPLTKLRFLAKYRHQKTEASSPDSVTIVDQSNPSNKQVFTNIRSPISSEVETVTSAVRYRLHRSITLKAEYTHEEKEREDENAEAWHLSNSIERDIFTFSADSRLPNNLKLKAKYIYRDIKEDTQSLALGIEPTRSNEGFLSLSWTPIPQVSAYLRYAMSKDKKDDFQVLDDSGVLVNSTDERERFGERFFGGITFWLYEGLCLTPNYTYLSNNVDQDLVYGAWSPASALVDDSVESNDEAHNYAVNISYTPVANLELSSLVNYTKSSGSFRPRASEALNPISIGSFSEVEIGELTLEFGLIYEFDNKMGLGVTFRYTDYDDDSSDNPQDGYYHLAQFMVSKKW